MESLKSLFDSLREDNYSPRVLVYGPSGTGKTYFGSTFPKPFFFDFDGGWLTLINRPVDGVSFADERGAGAYQKFEKLFNEKVKDPKVETLVIDSLTTFSEHLMRNVMSLQNKPADTVPDLRDWGIFIQRMKRLLYQVTAGRSKGLVMTAHEKIITDDAGLVKFVPLISGQVLPSHLSIWFDETYYSVVRGGKNNPEWFVETVGSSSTIAKSRLKRIIPTLDVREPNDWSVIWEKVKKGLAELNVNRSDKQKGNGDTETGQVRVGTD